MNKKFISVFMIGAATLATLGTVTSCKDYDDDIKDLQEQIDGTGVDLSAEVAKLQGLLDTNKAASEKAEAELADAIKNATNDANGYAEIQAAEAKKAAVDASAALIAQAIEDLENGKLQAAQSKADAAYSLAEQASAAAASNKGEIEKLATALGETNANLKSALDKIAETNDKLAATNKELSDVKKELADADKQIQDNKAKLSTLESSLTSLQESNEKAHKALSDKDDELKGLIEKNQADIKKIVEETIPAIDTRLKTAEGTIAQHTTDISANKNDIQTNKNEIEAIKKDITDNVKKDIQNNANDINVLKGEVAKINDKLDFLNKNFNNLITGLIFQDEQLEIVQAQVVNNVNPTGISGTFTETSGAKTLVWFPYKNAANAKNDLVVGMWNVERLAGPVYYTINPTNVNFSNNAQIFLENSLQAAPVKVKMSDPEASTRKSPITRAAEDKSPANGLYQSVITNEDLLRSAAHPGFANSYALFASYKQFDEAGKVTTKKVYSQYALNINVTNAGVQDNPVVEPVGAEGGPQSVCDARFITNFGEPMTGTLKLKPQNTEFGKTGATAKVYRKYVEVVGVSNDHNIAQTGTTLNNLKKAINDANKGILNTVFEEDTPGFDEITVTIPDMAGTYNFVGSTVEFRYFIQNYNGTIYAKNIKVMFTKTLFEEDGMDIEHTPYQSNVNTMLNGLAAASKTDFQIEANCIKVAASNKLWYEKTAKVEIKAIADLSGDYCKVKTIDFYTDENSANSKWIAQTPVYTVPMNDAVSASVSGMLTNKVKTIKNMIITYDPANIKVEKEYTFEMYSYDSNGNLISKLPIKFTMKYPNHHLDLIKPNPAFFTPYNKDMKAAKDLEGRTLTAWANHHKPSGTSYNATYNVIAAFNAPRRNADGCVMSFDYTNKDDYEKANSKFKDYKPINAWRLNYATNELDYTMEVPAKAVEYQKEHEYTLQLAVECFGVKSLWYAPYEFKVVFKSNIAWADFKWKNDLYEIEYPNKSLTIGDDEIISDDPSTSPEDDITYFGASRNECIKNTSVKLKDTQFASLFKTIEVASDGSGIKIETAETVPGGVGSIGTETDAVTFTFTVEDYYGNKLDYDFKVKVKENKK